MLSSFFTQQDGFATNTDATEAPFYFLFFASFRNSQARTHLFRTLRSELLLEKKKKIPAQINREYIDITALH